MSVMVLSVRLLHQAALWDNAELLEDLLNGEELTFINSCDSWGRTPLHAASTTESSQCLRWDSFFTDPDPGIFFQSGFRIQAKKTHFFQRH